MRKVFKLEDLECANCAAKMQDAISKIEGVEEVTISFLTQKMTINADEKSFDKIIKLAAKAIKKIEPDCRIVL